MKSNLFARIKWATVTEPNDHIAGMLVSLMGAESAWNLVAGNFEGAFELQAVDPLVTLYDSGVSKAQLNRALKRWRDRIDRVDPNRELARAQKIGAQIVVPEDDDWPDQLNDLGYGAPHCLWVRGDRSLLRQSAHGVSIVGSRSQTHYGEHITDSLSSHMVRSNRAVISGGAFGVDASAHRSVLVHGGHTVAVMAGGIDRLYPAGNSEILKRIELDGGALLSESPLGSLPMKSRFLSRNRLIAALSEVTVVVEAAARSGSLSTAHHALEIGRRVGAVPGPVTSFQSAGTNQLIRQGLAELVSSGNDLLEMMSGSEFTSNQWDSNNSSGSPKASDSDFLSPAETRVLDGLAKNRSISIDEIAVNSGLTPKEALYYLGILEMKKIVNAENGGWKFN